MSSKKKRDVKPSLGNSFTLKEIIAKTPNQQITIDAYEEGNNLCLHGVAGTGKTFLSVGLGLRDVLDGRYKRLVVVRSAVPSRAVGFLPGTFSEKTEVYEDPYKAICTELFGRGDAYEILKQRAYFEFLTTSHIRGTTIRDCVVVVDEFQNMNFGELDTIITRMGENCKVIFSGDLIQSDLKPNDPSGLPKFMNLLENIWDDERPEYSFEMVEFTTDDIVRGGLVKAYIKARTAILHQ